MKKIIAIALVLVMVLSLCACGAGKKDDGVKTIGILMPTKEQLLDMNAKLNKIKRPKGK